MAHFRSLDHLDLARSASPINYVHGDEPPMLVVHGTADQLVPYIQAELLVGAMDKARAPYYFHTVVGGDHNPYFGLKFDASGSSFNSGGGGIGLFEDPIVDRSSKLSCIITCWTGEKICLQAST